MKSEQPVKSELSTRADIPKSLKPSTKLVDTSKIRDENLEKAKNIAIQVAVVLVVGIVVFSLFRYRNNVAADNRNQASELLWQVRSDLNQYRSPNYRSKMLLDPAQILEDYTLRNQQLDSVVAKGASNDSATAAQVLLTRGDLNWLMQDLLSASTEPSSGQTSAADMLKSAKDAYAAVLAKYQDQPIAAAEARLGLAAVAENTGNFDEAANQYTAIVNDASSPSTMQNLAKFQLSQLDKIKVPLVINLPPPATQPATQTSAMGNARMGPEVPADLITATTLPVAASPTTQP